VLCPVIRSTNQPRLTPLANHADMNGATVEVTCAKFEPILFNQFNCILCKKKHRVYRDGLANEDCCLWAKIP